MTGSSRHLERIAGLLRKSEGTDNQYEAEAYLARAQALATAHAIDLALARASDTGGKRATPTTRQITIGAPGTKGLSTYVRLFLAIAHANDVVLDAAHNSTWVIAYGMDTDIAAVELLYARLLPQMIEASTAYLRSAQHRGNTTSGKRVAGITARLAFQTAFAARIGLRLAAARNTAQAQAISAQTPTTGPGTALVLRAKQLEITDYYRTHSKARGTWRPTRRRSRPAPHASIAGNAAGNLARLTDQRSLPAARGQLRP